MKNLFTWFMVIGCLLILFAVALRMCLLTPLVIASLPVKPSSILILANISFSLAILFRKK